jgi:asparagine synthase (glutamine-hydrolysing)
MFSIALWDVRERTLLLARDRLGVKPMYWAPVAGGLLYASEPHAILASGLVPARPDLHALGQYLTLQYVPPPSTGFRGIRKLAPGEAMTYRGGAIRAWRWWELPSEPAARPSSDAEMLDELDELMRRATASRLRSDVPLGAFLSGGIDSSLVVAYMAEALPRVRTFSVDFPVAAFSEGAHARRVAAIYGTEHEEFVVAPDIIPTLPAVVRRLGEPFADSSAIPTYLLSELTSRHVTVALSGDGGDEAFGGYERYRVASTADRLSALSKPLGRLGLRLLPGVDGGPTSRRVRRGLQALVQPPHERYAFMMAHFMPGDVARMTLPASRALVSGARDAWENVLALPDVRGVSRYMALDVATYLPGDLLVKVDRMSMAHSLEVRSPLLDYRVQEFAAALPGGLKVRRGRLKWPLKELAARRGLPHDLVHRRKQGFGIPIGPWLRDELRPWLVDVLTDPRTRDRGYFAPASVERLIGEHVAGTLDHTGRLWNLVMLELWHRSAIDGPA